MLAWKCNECDAIWYTEEGTIPGECPDCESYHIEEVDVWECSECHAVWYVEKDTVPIVCPNCAGTGIDKVSGKPGGMKPINWPGSFGG